MQVVSFLFKAKLQLLFCNDPVEINGIHLRIISVEELKEKQTQVHRSGKNSEEDLTVNLSSSERIGTQRKVQDIPTHIFGFLVLFDKAPWLYNIRGSNH